MWRIRIQGHSPVPSPQVPVCGRPAPRVPIQLAKNTGRVKRREPLPVLPQVLQPVSLRERQRVPRPEPRPVPLRELQSEPPQELSREPQPVPQPVPLPLLLRVPEPVSS